MSINPFPPADFTPSQENYTRQGAFRFWCQTALPLVYDDSLSYYELLNKVVVYLNNVISDVSATETNVENLLTAYNQLQNYVNSYFIGLDIQEEINTKLDEMASSGELTALIEPFLPDIISNWLQNNITPTTPPIDKTLTVENAAADSKIVGDNFKKTSTKSDYIIESITDSLEHEIEQLRWQQGGINGNTGVNSTDSTRIRSIGYQSYENVGCVSVICPEGYKVGIREFSDTGTPSYNYFVHSIPEGTVFFEGNYMFVPVSNHYYRYVLAKTDNTTLAPTDVPAGFSVNIISDITEILKKINQINNEVNVIINSLPKKPEELAWVQGGINANTGITSDDTTRIRSSGYQTYENVGGVSIICPSGYKVGIREFSGTGTPSYDYFVGSIPEGTDFVDNNFIFTPVSNHYYRYVLAKKDNTTLAPTDVPADFSVNVIGSINEIIDNVKEIDNTIDLIINSLPKEAEELSWTQGGINANTGVNSSDTTRVRSNDYQSYENVGGVSIICPSGYKVGIREFSGTGTPSYDYFVRSIPEGTAFFEGNYMFVPVSNHYYRYVLAKTDNTTLAPADVPAGFSVNVIGSINEIIDNVKEIDNTIDLIINSLPKEAEELSWTQGGINANTGVNSKDTTRVRSNGYQSYENVGSVSIICPSGYKVGIREFSGTGTPSYDYFVRSIPEGTVFFEGNYMFVPVSNHYYRYVLAKTDNTTLAPADVPAGFSVNVIGNQNNAISQLKNNVIANMFKSNIGNAGILCAKEHHYIDGSSPTIEYYLIGDPATNKVYYTKDMKSKIELFTFSDRLGYWSFGIDSNNNIICCKQAEYLSDTLGGDDSLRVNPIVYLSDENYKIAHNVNFGNNLKPCGWLSSVGFICLENGDCLISEYTRPTVNTAHIWKISGDPSNASSWSNKASFTLSGSSSTGFKHIHCVQQDFYTGICYFGTGDDDTSSHIYYSLDNGNTWTAGKENNEKYCRLLNIIFTKDWCYWSTDSNKPNYHYVFKAPRRSDGVIDFDNITDLIEIPLISDLATYGCVYYELFNALLLLERVDTTKATTAPVRLYDIETNTLHTVYTLESVNPNGDHLGFRTRFADWYPKGNKTLISWHLRGTSIGSQGYNPNKMFGNKAVGDTTNDINNAILTINKNGSDYNMTIDTNYI